MKMTLLTGAIFFTMLSGQAHATIRCEADFGAIQSGTVVQIQIDDENQSKVSGFFQIVGGPVMTFKDAGVTDFSVRRDISYSNPPDSLNLNFGERRLALLQSYIDTPEMTPVLKWEKVFSANDVSSVRIYDIGGDAYTNLMGGTPLVEFRNASGELLGRFAQGVLITTCK